MGRVPAVSDLDQAGVATRAQLLALGLAPGLIRQQVRSGRWQALHVGVYATFSGPVQRCPGSGLPSFAPGRAPSQVHGPVSGWQVRPIGHRISWT